MLFIRGKKIHVVRVYISPQQKDKNVSSRRAKIRVRFNVYRNHRLLEQCIMIYIIDITKKKLFLSSQSS